MPVLSPCTVDSSSLTLGVSGDFTQLAAAVAAESNFLANPCAIAFEANSPTQVHTLGSRVSFWELVYHWLAA